MQTYFDSLSTAIEAHKKDAMTNLNLLYFIMDLNIVSSMGKRTSTCLMYCSSYDKFNVYFIELCFYVTQPCQWDPHDRARTGWQASKSIGQRDWSRMQHNKFYRKLCKQTFLFFSRLKRDVFFNFCVWHKKGVLWKHPIRENNTYVCFH